MKIRRLLAGVAIAVLMALGTAPALAQYASPTASPQISSEQDETPPRPRSTATVRGRTTRDPGDPARGGTGGLSVTGSDIAMLAAIGVGSAGSGALMVAASRRRRKNDDAE